jgi:hypothetical protein
MSIYNLSWYAGMASKRLAYNLAVLPRERRYRRRFARYSLELLSSTIDAIDASVPAGLAPLQPSVADIEIMKTSIKSIRSQGFDRTWKLKHGRELFVYVQATTTQDLIATDVRGETNARQHNCVLEFSGTYGRGRSHIKCCVINTVYFPEPSVETRTDGDRSMYWDGTHLRLTDYDSGPRTQELYRLADFEFYGQEFYVLAQRMPLPGYRRRKRIADLQLIPERLSPAFQEGLI